MPPVPPRAAGYGHSSAIVHGAPSRAQLQMCMLQLIVGLHWFGDFSYAYHRVLPAWQKARPCRQSSEPRYSPKGVLTQMQIRHARMIKRVQRLGKGSARSQHDALALPRQF